MDVVAVIDKRIERKKQSIIDCENGIKEEPYGSTYKKCLKEVLIAYKNQLEELEDLRREVW